MVTCDQITTLHREDVRKEALGGILSPARLLEVWQRCGLDGRSAEACDRGLRTAEQLVRGDAPPDRKKWGLPQ